MEDIFKKLLENSINMYVKHMYGFDCVKVVCIKFEKNGHSRSVSFNAHDGGVLPEYAWTVINNELDKLLEECED